ncbi:hypothetical protein LSTR_LSTR000782 [Laodelphax striatellus]|uniref:Mitogen-activated protein kinase kinase kinase 4 n=1 Tax=Laodelphax striatellus TaxID=195883 RepID=A0A482XH11_LAOST|nr:hypothetical protein LSTR_LSTR000782 [Laodelphax striatellus]
MSDWKKRLGIEINYSSDDDERNPNGETSPTFAEEQEFLDSVWDYDHKYGSTPPRTRMTRRNRSRREKEQLMIGKSAQRSSSTKQPAFSDDCIDAICESDEEENNHSESKRSSYNSKRSIKMLRCSERDLKLDLSETRSRLPSSISHLPRDERVESLPQLAKKVETCNRFLSLTSKLVVSRNLGLANGRSLLPQEECVQNRVEFYETFSKLIQMGNCDTIKRQIAAISQEDHLWQNELNDLIWLELQAWHADRSLQEQDQFLCQAREDIHNLLDEIMNYKFKKRADQLSASSADSGIHFPNDEQDIADPVLPNGTPCTGLCLSMSCPTCFEDQNCALRDVEGMLTRLEAAEALYPSSKSFAAQHPLYLSDKFTARVKAMCLWYNMTKHHRLKLLILVRHLLSHAARKNFRGESKTPSEEEQLEEKDFKFCNYDKDDHDEWKSWLDTNLYNIEPVGTFCRYAQQIDGNFSRVYIRKYIEDVLKIRGLRKALHFLEKLHLSVLRKAKFTLQKPSDEENFAGDADLEDMDAEEVRELKQFGCWSEEALALNLPSYRSAFLFVSRVPLDVIHEFLSLRLETKPEKPSPMSIRQLIKELKEGLRLAVLHRQRYQYHIYAALSDPNDIAEDYMKEHIDSFDATVQNVLELYLDYLQQWVQFVQEERVQKNILEEEWGFAMQSCNHIPGGHALVGSSFCRMASSMMKCISHTMKSKSEDQIQIIDIECEYNKLALLEIGRGLQQICIETREKALHVVALSKTLRKDLENDQDNKPSLHCNIIADSLSQLKRDVVSFGGHMKGVIKTIEASLQVPQDLDESEKNSLQVRFREVLHQFFKFGFEYLKEVCRLVTGNSKSQLCRASILFAHHWMQFVKERCERGRGLRPRWAHQGLEFLMMICDPRLTSHLTDEEFEDLKTSMDDCISHVIGTATPPINTSPPCYVASRSRGPSPCPSATSPRAGHRRSMNSQSSVEAGDKSADRLGDPNKEPNWFPSTTHRSRRISRSERVQQSVNTLDEALESNLRTNNLIGSVVATEPTRVRNFNYPRPVNFKWQRGIKIGQGRFGKVYTAVNNETGELMAMKEIALQPNDRCTIKNVAQEIKIFEGIKHENLVRYYGVEIHRDEMLLFMELCTEGTLESLVAATESALPEALIRRYTNQLVRAVSVLHQHAIVHRDIKSANIFLTAEGNCLKVGDFGSAVKIKSHTTVPGEVQGFVGTQAYMAPEVFMKTNTEGHGRAVDIWSLGCVLVEMASGKRPWAEFDSNYQIMFKVGMGETPEIPSTLSDEGAHFASLCLRHDPKERATTMDLIQHSFLQVDGDEECLSCTMPSILEDYLKLGIKR